MLRESEIVKNESWNEIGKVLEEEMSTVEDVRDSLIRTEKGKVKNSIENCVMILNRDPVLKGTIRRNDLSIKTDIVRSLPWRDKPGSISDVDLFQIQRYIENTYKVTSEKNVNKAINIVASEQRYHPIKQYLEGLQWDGTPRIGSLLPKFLGADESAYTRELMQLLMIAAIHRIYHPGLHKTVSGAGYRSVDSFMKAFNKSHALVEEYLQTTQEVKVTEKQKSRTITP